MFAGFKKFDVHIKAVDGVNQQTVLGAALTLISTVLVLVLIMSEISVFNKVDVVSRMLADNTAGVESVKLEFDVNFFNAPCDKISYFQEVTRGTLHVHEPGTVEKFDLDDGTTVGCHVRGSSLIDKVGGNFRFAVEQIAVPQSNTPPNESPPNVPANFSHIINRIAFVSTKGESALEKIPEVSHSLQDQVTIVPDNAAVYHYEVEVVPTQYKTLYGELSFANQYSVDEKSISVEALARTHGSIGGIHLRDFSGILFTYDFHPVMLYMEERRERIVDFIVTLLGIVGGVITVLSLLEGCLHQSTKALIGKKD